MVSKIILRMQISSLRSQIENLQNLPLTIKRQARIEKLSNELQKKLIECDNAKF